MSGVPARGLPKTTTVSSGSSIPRLAGCRRMIELGEDRQPAAAQGILQPRQRGGKSWALVSVTMT